MQRVLSRPAVSVDRVVPSKRRAETAQSGVIIGMVLLLLVLGLVVRATIATEYRREAQGVLAEIERSAQKLASRTDEVFDRVDQVTLLVKHLREEAARPSPATSLRGLRRAGVLGGDFVRAVVIVDARGLVVDASDAAAQGADLSTDAAYRRARESESDPGTIEIGQTAPNALLGGAAAIPVLRRLSAADGSFGGAVLALVDPQALSAQNEKTEEDDTAIGVVGTDGVFRARLLGGRVSYGARLDLAAVQVRTRQVRATLQPLPMPSNAAGRFATNVPVAHYPLIAVVAVVAVDAERSLESYRRSRTLILSWAGAVALLIVGGAALLWVRVREIEAGRNRARRTEAALRATMEGSMDAVSILRAQRGPSGELLDMIVVDTNERAAALHGGTREQVLGRGVCVLRPSIREVGQLDRFKQAMRTGRALEVELQAISPPLTGRWLHHQMVPLDEGCAMITRDVTERREAERALASMARTDPLTGLGNRRDFEQRLAEARARAQRSRQALAVVYLDLDGFKGVNDRLGHAVGDQVLIGVAARLREGVRATDAVSRLGGDEFAAVLENAGSSADLAALCQRLVTSIAQPHRLDGGDVVCTPSLGAAMLRPNETPQALVQRADAAMYAAKQAGKCAFRIDGEGVSEVPHGASIC